MKTQAIIKNANGPIDELNAILELRNKITKKICGFPDALIKEKNTKICNGEKIGNFLYVTKFSNLKNSWQECKSYEYGELSDNVNQLAERLKSYANKRLVDAIVYTLERIKRGNKAKCPKYWRDTNEWERQEKIRNGEKVHNSVKYDFYNEGCGFTLTDGEKKFIFDFEKKYFNIK